MFPTAKWIAQGRPSLGEMAI